MKLHVQTVVRIALTLVFLCCISLLPYENLGWKGKLFSFRLQILQRSLNKNSGRKAEHLQHVGDHKKWNPLRPQEVFTDKEQDKVLLYPRREDSRSALLCFTLPLSSLLIALICSLNSDFAWQSSKWCLCLQYCLFFPPGFFQIFCIVAPRIICCG